MTVAFFDGDEVGMSLSTRASLAKPNFEIGSLLSNAGKSVSTSPSSSAMCSEYASMCSLKQNRVVGHKNMSLKIFWYDTNY